MRELHIAAVAAAYATQRYEDMERLIEVLQARVSDPMQRLTAHRIRLSALIAQQRLQDAIAYMLRILSELGLSLPPHATKAHALKAILTTRVLWRGRTIADLESLPQANEPVLEGHGEIMHASTAAC